MRADCIPSSVEKSRGIKSILTEARADLFVCVVEAESYVLKSGRTRDKSLEESLESSTWMANVYTTKFINQ